MQRSHVKPRADSTTAAAVRTARSHPDGHERYREPDCIHWLPSMLDAECEQCFCLSCGEDLPCPCQVAIPNSIQEPIHHA